MKVIIFKDRIFFPDGIKLIFFSGAPCLFFGPGVKRWLGASHSLPRGFPGVPESHFVLQISLGLLVVFVPVSAMSKLRSNLAKLTAPISTPFLTLSHDLPQP